MNRVGEVIYEATITYNDGKTLKISNWILDTLKKNCRPYIRNENVVSVDLKRVKQLTPLKVKL